MHDINGLTTSLAYGMAFKFKHCDSLYKLSSFYKVINFSMYVYK